MGRGGGELPDDLAQGVRLTVGIASSASRPTWSGHRHEWTDDEARELVAATCCAAFLVYDAESYILWRPVG